MLIKMEIPEALESINIPEKVADVFRAILATENEVDRDKEHVWIMGLDSAHHIKYIELVTLGLLNSSLIHPREVYRMAVMQGVCGIILAHNHPSGKAEASDNDIKVTEMNKNAGKILEIPLFDHVIVAGGRYYSFHENGLI